MTYDDMTTAAAGAVLQDIPGTSRLLKAMANPARLRALCLLARGERCAGDLGAGMGLSQSAAAQHLARLRRDGLVNTRRDAQTIFYSLDGADALAVIAVLARIVEAGVTATHPDPTPDKRCEIRWCSSGRPAAVRVNENIDDGCFTASICRPCADALGIAEGADLPYPPAVKRAILRAARKESAHG